MPETWADTRLPTDIETLQLLADAAERVPDSPALTVVKAEIADRISSLEVMREWAATNLAGKTVEEMRAMQEAIFEQRWEAEAEVKAAEVVSQMIGEAIDQAVAQNPPVAEMAKGRTEVSFAVAKSTDALRFTLGPLYEPDATDAHGHTADADTLQQAGWEWFAKGDRTIRLQHSEAIAGELVEFVSWPEEHTTTMTKADGTSYERTFPPGTPWVGVRWQPWAWNKLQRGEITGLSLAGMASLEPVN